MYISCYNCSLYSASKDFTDASGKIIDVKIEYPSDITQQHLMYGEKYSFLPTYY